MSAASMSSAPKSAASRRSELMSFRSLVLLLGFLFLYVPMFSLIVFSFNESRMVTVWSGFSVKWYGELFRDQLMLDAAWMSLKIAFYTACASVVLGMCNCQSARRCQIQAASSSA